jgi:hypothetical protein
MTTLWDKFKSAIRWVHDETAAAVAVMDVAMSTDPEWSEQDLVTPDTLPGPPSSAADGVNLQQAIVALLAVRLRGDASSRQADVTIEVLDLAGGASHTVTINGTDFTEAADTDVATTLTNLAATINAGAEPVTATTDDTNDDGDVDTLRISGDTANDYTIAVSSTSGELGLAADATEVSFRIWLRADDVWYVAADGTYEAIRQNWIERAEVAGCDRLFVEVFEADGRVVPVIGPGVMEGG